MSKKNIDIPIKKKIKIAFYINNNPGLSQRSVANMCSISVGSVIKIFKDNINLINLKSFNYSAISERKRKISKRSQFDDILFQWIQNQRMRNIMLSNYSIKNIALTLATKFEINGFDASDGYIRRDKIKHNLVTKTVCGEAGLVD